MWPDLLEKFDGCADQINHTEGEPPPHAPRALRRGANLRIRPIHVDAHRDAPSPDADVCCASIVAGDDARRPAQNGQDAAFHPYPLRHVHAADVQGRIQRLLSGVPGGAEVVADPSQNRLLVQGPPRAHALTAQVLQTLDRPMSESKPAASIVRTYQVNRGDLEQIVEALEAQFPAATGVRIAADRRLSQVVVVAPPEIQAEIGKRLPSASNDEYDARTAPGAVPQQPAVATAAAANTRAFATPAANTTGGRAVSTAGPAGDPRGYVTHAANTTGAHAVKPQTPPQITKPPAGQYMRVQAGPSGQLLHLRTGCLAMEKSLTNLWREHFQPSPTTNPNLAIYTASTSKERLRLHFDRKASEVAIHGPAGQVGRCAALLAVLDQPQVIAQGEAGVLRMQFAQPLKIIEACKSYQQGTSRVRAVLRRADCSPAGKRRSSATCGGTVPAARRTSAAGAQPPPVQPGQPQTPPNRSGQPAPPESGKEGNLIGPVQLEILQDLDAIIIRGPKQDVERIKRIIEQIENISAQTEPVIEIRQLEHVGSEAITQIVGGLYDTVYAARRGRVSITPLVKPNALLLIGQHGSIDAVLKLVDRLDTPAQPGAEFRVFQLRNMSATEAQAAIDRLYAPPEGQTLPPGLAPRVLTIGDYRTNAVVVRASPRNLADVAALLRRLDTQDSKSEMVLRVYQLSNSLAQELAGVLQSAITGGAGPPTPQAQARAQGVQQPQQAGGATQRSSILKLLTLDAEERRLLKSGILTDVQITADARANALIVRAPADSHDLIAALIEQLDQIPGADGANQGVHRPERRRPEPGRYAPVAVRAADHRRTVWRRTRRRRGRARRRRPGSVAVRDRHAHQLHHRDRLRRRFDGGRGDSAAS